MRARAAIRSIVETLRACEDRIDVRLSPSDRLYEIVAELGGAPHTSVYLDTGRAIDSVTLSVGPSSIAVSRYPDRVATREELDARADEEQVRRLRECG